MFLLYIDLSCCIIKTIFFNRTGKMIFLIDCYVYGNKLRCSFLSISVNSNRDSYGTRKRVGHMKHISSLKELRGICIVRKMLKAQRWLGRTSPA
jgi:hypothetical protein